jgi:hypothetical protein
MGKDMERNRLTLALQADETDCFKVGKLPERFRMTQNDIDDLQRDAEPFLRSSKNDDTLGDVGSYRRPRW